MPAFRQGLTDGRKQQADLSNALAVVLVGALQAIQPEYAWHGNGQLSRDYLGTKEDSARKNISIYLKDLGIVDDEGKPSERARRWRDNSQYEEVCREILEEIYLKNCYMQPQIQLTKEQAERWFANHTGAGRFAVRKMANLYALLREADFSGEPGPRPDQKSKSIRLPTGARAARKSSKAVEQRANGGERIVN